MNAVRANMTARGIYPSFVNWWNNFFGVNGLVVQYYTIVNGPAPNITYNLNDLATTSIVNGAVVNQVNIPSELMSIVNWVT